MTVKEGIEKYRDEMIQVRRHLHENPELSEHEYETCKYICEHLEKAGIPYELTPSKRSIVATVKGGHPGKTIVLRADYDALPIEEETGLPFSSKVKGVMHACGHDTHGAVGLAVALILNDRKEEMHGNAKILFQEAEETMFGALHALESGLLDDCDNSIMSHVAVDRDTGVFLCNYGVRCAKVGSVRIDVKGKGAHSSRPDTGVNAAIIGAKIVDAISYITAYEIPRNEFVVFSPTVIQSGTKENIIPETCHIEANARYFDDRYDEILSKKITDICEGIAHAYGAEVVVDYKGEGTPMINDDKMTDHAMELIARLYGEDKIIRTPAGLFGDDYAFIQKKCPGVVVNIGAAKDGKYTNGHNARMMVDEAYMDIACEFLTTYILEYCGVKENL